MATYLKNQKNTDQRAMSYLALGAISNSKYQYFLYVNVRDEDLLKVYSESVSTLEPFPKDRDFHQSLFVSGSYVVVGVANEEKGLVEKLLKWGFEKINQKGTP